MSEKLKKLKDVKTEELNALRKKTALKCISSYHHFFKVFFETATNSKLVDNWHIKYICDKLQSVGSDILLDRIPEKEFLVINVPPGTSKSTMISVLFPIWLWIIKPNTTIITTSYSNALSVDLARKSKSVIESDMFRVLFDPIFLAKYGKTLSFSPDTDGDYTNNFGGRRYATSVGGTVTGFHANAIICDDILSAQGAYSQAEIAASNRYFNETLMTRKKCKERTKTIVVMQRLHIKDLTGMLVETQPESIDHIVMPAELTNDVKPKEISKYYEDGLLDKNRLKKKTIDSFRVRLGSLGFSGQMLQNPIAIEGNILKSSWFPIQRGLYQGITNLYIDGAYTKNVNNDPTGLLITSSDQKYLYIKYWSAQHLEMPELLRYIETFYYNGMLDERSRIYIEPKASGLSLIQMLKTKGKNAIAIKSKLVNEGKLARANLISPFAESGRILLEEANWNDEFITELCSFPTGRHDESIDVLGYAVDNELNKGGSVSIYDDGSEKYSPDDNTEVKSYLEKMMDIGIQNGASYVDYLYPD